MREDGNHLGNHLRTRELLAGLEPEDAAAVRHLIVCDDCTLNALQSLPAAEPADGVDPAPPPAVDYSGVWTDLEARTPGLIRELRERRDEASALLKKLQSRPVRERAGTVRRETRFHQPHLAELMLEKGQLEADARRSEELARLALLVAVKAAPGIPADTAQSLKARACCLLGNALCSQGRLSAADEAFRGSAFHLTGPLHSLERAVFCQMLARLRMSQGRLDEALALLWRAGYLYGEEGDFHEQGVCLAQIGFRFLDADSGTGALAPLERARAVLDAGLDPALACRVRLALALCQAESDHGSAAGALVEEARRFYGHIQDRVEKIRIFWLEARIAARTGLFPEAAELLASVRGQLLAGGQLHDAALATIDLALLLGQRSRSAEIHPLIQEFIESFSSHPGTPGILLALGAFEVLAVQGREDLEAAAAIARRFLCRMKRRHGPAKEK